MESLLQSGIMYASLGKQDEKQKEDRAPRIWEDREMITINCGFSKNVRRPHKRTVIEQINVTGIRLRMKWDRGNHLNIRCALMKHKPAGEGWEIDGYVLTDIKNENR